MFEYPAELNNGYQTHVPRAELICDPQTVVTERKDLDSSKFVIRYRTNCTPVNGAFTTKIINKSEDPKFKQKDGRIIN